MSKANFAKTETSGGSRVSAKLKQYLGEAKVDFFVRLTRTKQPALCLEHVQAALYFLLLRLSGSLLIGFVGYLKIHPLIRTAVRPRFRPGL